MSLPFNSPSWAPGVSTAPRVDTSFTHSSNQPAFQMPQSIGTSEHIPSHGLPATLPPRPPSASSLHTHATPTTHSSNQPAFLMTHDSSKSERFSNHGQASSDSCSTSHSPLMDSPRMGQALSNRSPPGPLSPPAASLQNRGPIPNLNPRLTKQILPGPSLYDRVLEFDREIQTPSSSKIPVESPVGQLPRPLGSFSAERQHTVYGDARPAHMTDNNLAGNGVHPGSLAGAKRPRSPGDEQGSGSDSADGVTQFGQRRAAKLQETGRLRLRRDSYQPNRTIKSRTSDSEDGDSLFVPARALKIESSTSSDTDIDTTTKKPSSARELKQRLAGKHTRHFSRKVNPEKDPENIAIKRMRCDERMQFDDIADVLNKQRVSKGLEPTFTANAVYGRFQRMAPRIAALEGHPDFNYRDYLHIPREARLTPTRHVSLPNMAPQQERLFVEAYEMVKREVWVYTAAKFEEMGGFHLSPEQAALKFKSI